TFKVTLANASNATLGVQNSVDIKILDNDTGFQFEFANYSVSEDAGVCLVNVLRGTDETNVITSVELTVVDGTGTNGVDYLAANATLAFAPGEKLKPVPIKIVNNGLKQAARTFSLNLANPATGATLGSRNHATVRIADNDSGLGFELATYPVSKRRSEVVLN